MKELSIGEKAKAYDNVVSKLGRFMAQGVDPLITRADVQDFFPELNDDERIRKWCISHFRECFRVTKDNAEYQEYLNNKVIPWLEKQDNSPSEVHYWTEEEIEPIISDYLRGAEHYGGMIGRLRCLKPKSLEKQGEQPKQEWSAFDETNLQGIIDEIVANKINAPDYDQPTYDKFLNWLESLRPQNRWKPSDEQIKTCKEVYSDLLSAKGFDLATVNSEINRLEEQLKKLESVKPQSQWKPSDDQMDALAWALSLAKNCGEEKAFDLRTLHEQLKKLKG